ncbi:glutathione-specific gamma-glutamylcyclotransferase 1 [Diabrotica undecimpunctata]|uniref:glutathione-specific gamma-glutamylcyclotransferase 1 n=1 Tax=Diabrotica undecimpunctata TaxID=50387 RepID=UPI003B63A738
MNITELQTEISNEDTKALWVFAYGSLCWKPGFEFHKAITGFVKGYERRFWQGNKTHRGTCDQPGRVATLVEDEVGKVHGVAFAISGEAAIPYLSQRECKLGGYISHFTDFYPLQGESFKVLVYIATPNNPHWMGQADAKTLAEQIVKCKGASGSNVEYVLRLANFVREHFSDQQDPHLFELEREVLMLVRNERLCLETLMGDGEGCVSFIKGQFGSSTSQQLEVEEDRTDTHKFTMRIQATKLRCLNI